MARQPWSVSWGGAKILSQSKISRNRQAQQGSYRSHLVKILNNQNTQLKSITLVQKHSKLHIQKFGCDNIKILE